MVDSKYLPSNEEFTKAHDKLHTALISHFGVKVAVLSKEEYNSSYFQIEGTEERFFYMDIRFGGAFDAFDLDDFLNSLFKMEEQEVPLIFKKKKYEFDIFIPSVNLDIEVDGASHERASVQVKDGFRDKLLKEQGIIVKRYTDKELSSEKKIENVVKEIDELVQDLMKLKLSRRVR